MSTTASTWGKPHGRIIIGMRVVVCRWVLNILTMKDRTGINPMWRLNAELAEKSPLSCCLVWRAPLFILTICSFNKMALHRLRQHLTTSAIALMLWRIEILRISVIYYQWKPKFGFQNAYLSLILSLLVNILDNDVAAAEHMYLVTNRCYSLQFFQRSRDGSLTHIMYCV